MRAHESLRVPRLEGSDGLGRPSVSGEDDLTACKASKGDPDVNCTNDQLGISIAEGQMETNASQKRVGAAVVSNVAQPTATASPTVHSRRFAGSRWILR